VTQVFALSHDTVWLVSFVGPLLVMTGTTVAVAFWREPRIRRRIKARAATGVDEREASGTLHLPVVTTTAVALVTAVLSRRRLGYGTSVTTDNERCEVRCRLGPNWRTWGQAVTVQVVPSGDGTDVIVRTWPTTDRATTDWGRGKSVVEPLHAQLEVEVGSSPAAVTNPT